MAIWCYIRLVDSVANFGQKIMEDLAALIVDTVFDITDGLEILTLL